MPIYQPSELQAFLKELGKNPKKSLSQNFLIDGNIVRKIVATCKIEPEDVVLEIGSGPGALTEALLEAGATVIAVEKDPVLAEALKRFGKNKPLFVHSSDIQVFPIEKALREHLLPGKKGIVVGNLPYHLTTPIITQIAPLYATVRSLVVMVQKEVAIRFTANPGNRDWGSISVFLNFFGKPEFAFTVSQNCFYPVPDVQSAVVSLELRETPKVPSISQFFEMTRTCFEQRRKMIRKTLGKLYPQNRVTDALIRIGCSELARPEELSVEQWVDLLNILNNSRNGSF